ncbi:MAG: CCA tRNA nucleotidyltransferase [Planctomycetales bacterium]
MPDPKREFAVEVVRRLREGGHVALWAGGCVRDFLLGRTPKDYDVATDARPEQVRELFGERRTRAVGASFGVILVHGPRGAGSIEVATFRTEGPYSDSRRPDTIAFATAEEDARRRDFTINGIFYDPLAQRVLDFVGGEEDLGKGVVRAIGDPRARMTEDKLRLLRAVRFAAMLDFELDPATAEAVREMAPQIHLVSAERIAQELKRMLVDPHRMRAVRLARELGLLAEILPELFAGVQAVGVQASACTPAERAPDSLKAELQHSLKAELQLDRTLHMLQHLDEPRFEPALAALLHTVPDAAAEICRRLRLSNHETDDVVWLLEHRDALDDAPRLSKSRLKRLLAHRLFEDLLRLERVKLLAAGDDLAPVLFCEDYLRTTPREEIDPPPLVTGNDLIAEGLVPGPRFKEILEAVRDAHLEGEVATREEALALVDRLSSNRGD